MRVEVVAHQGDPRAVGVASFQQPGDLHRPVRLRTPGPRRRLPPTRQRLAEQEDRGRAGPFVLVVDAARARLRGRHRRARFLDQLHRLLIHAHDRTIRVVGSLIQIQDLFHVRHELGISLRRDHPEWDGRVNCRPLAGPSDDHPVRLLAPRTPGGYAAERQRIMDDMKRQVRAAATRPPTERAIEKQLAKALTSKGRQAQAHTLPERLLDALTLETADYQDRGWSRPPGAREIVYARAPETAPRLSPAPPAAAPPRPGMTFPPWPASCSPAAPGPASRTPSRSAR